MSADVDLTKPWTPMPTGRTGNHERELYREVSSGHPLHGMRVTAIAMRGDNDDVLFEIEGAPSTFAVVHLTWSGSSEPFPFPETELYSTIEEWIERRMKPDHREWTAQ